MLPPSDLPSRLHFFAISPDAFDEAVATWGWPKFRGQQVRDWVYAKQIADPQRMTNLSPRDRSLLAEKMQFAAAEVTRRQSSSDGTQKLLLTWPDPMGGAGANAETVMIPDADRRTACVSSQVGCPVRCKFCASGINGVKGNLSAAQIVEQVYRLNLLMQEPASPPASRDDGAVESEAADDAVPFGEGEANLGGADRVAAIDRFPGRVPMSRSAAGMRHSSSRPSGARRPTRITNVVFMGMGEPLSNYANVMQAVRTLHDPKCFNLGARRITISTVGVPAKMRELADEDLPLNLAISLHAPNESLRKQLIPWAEHFALDDILNAARYYFDRTGREVTLEYILLSGVNDRPEHATQLARLCRTLRANVNLIRYNEVDGLPFRRPQGDDVMTFQTILRNNGVNTHVRKSRGRDIDAACGQLRKKQEDEQKNPLVALGGVTA